MKALDYNKYKAVLILIDDDQTRGQKLTMERKHVPHNYKIPYRIMAFEDEIEELILFSRRETYSGKASDHLKQKYQYKKNQLPDWVSKIDLDVICKHHLIKELIEFVEDNIS